MKKKQQEQVFGETDDWRRTSSSETIEMADEEPVIQHLQHYRNCGKFAARCCSVLRRRGLLGAACVLPPDTTYLCACERPVPYSASYVSSGVSAFLVAFCVGRTGKGFAGGSGRAQVSLAPMLACCCCCCCSISAAAAGVAHAPSISALHLCCCCWRCSCPRGISYLFHATGDGLSTRADLLFLCLKILHCYTSSRGSGNVGDAEIKMINECYDKCINDALEGGKSHSHMPADTHNTKSSSRPSLPSKLHFPLVAI